MIARLRALLQFELAVASTAALAEYERTIDGRTVLICAPYRSQFEPDALAGLAPERLSEVADRLDPAEPQPADDLMRLNGEPTVTCDTAQVEVLDGDFVRTSGDDDPTVDVAFRAANDFLSRLRALPRASHVRPVSPESTIWVLQYLNDDRSELEPQDGFVRMRAGYSWHWQTLGISSGLWAAVRDLPDSYEAPRWRVLLLDAVALLPEIGPPIVLAATSIETVVAHVLDRLSVGRNVDQDLWKWITIRGGRHTLQPSVAESLDDLPTIFEGRSLKADERLWKAWNDLSKARNSFAHEGVATIGGQVVTAARARELVVLAGEIVEWVEHLLPEDARSPTYDAGRDRMELEKWLYGRDAARAPRLTQHGESS